MHMGWAITQAYVKLHSCTVNLLNKRDACSVFSPVCYFVKPHPSKIKHIRAEKYKLENQKHLATDRLIAVISSLKDES